MTRTRLALVAAMALVAASCADLKVQVQYAPDAKIEKRLLNRAVSEFVRQVVTDPDLTQRLVAAR